MLCNLTERWHLCCQKHWCTNVNAYPNIYSYESICFFKGNLTIQFNHDDLAQAKKEIVVLLTVYM